MFRRQLAQLPEVDCADQFSPTTPARSATTQNSDVWCCFLSTLFRARSARTSSWVTGISPSMLIYMRRNTVDTSQSQGNQRKWPNAPSTVRKGIGEFHLLDASVLPQALRRSQRWLQIVPAPYFEGHNGLRGSFQEHQHLPFYCVRLPYDAEISSPTQVGDTGVWKVPKLR